MELYYGTIILYFMNYHKLGGVWFIGTHRLSLRIYYGNTDFKREKSEG